MKFEDYQINLWLSKGPFRDVILGREAEDPDITYEELQALEQEAQKPEITQRVRRKLQ